MTNAPDPAAQTLAGLLQQLDKSQWRPMAEIQALQRQKLVRLAMHCHSQSPHFRARMDAVGLTPQDLASPSALFRVPLMSRRDLQANAAAIFCAQAPALHQPVGETRTSGSTGVPVVVKRTAVSHMMWMATTMRELIWNEVDFGEGFSASRATISEYAEAPDWGAPTTLLVRTGRAQAIPITASVAQHVEWIASFKPQTLLIYPNVLDALARHCANEGVAFEGLRLVLTVGETLSAETRAAAQSALGATIADNYSSQEVGTIALQCPESGLYHVMAEALIVEVLRENGDACAEGEIGRVVVSDLTNFATPMVRYDIGDYAEVGPPCPCGRGLPTLRRVVGRERNLIVMPDGSRHWPLVGFSKFRDAAPVVQYQLVQHARNAIEVRLVVERTMTEAEEDALRNVIQGALGHPFQLSFRLFDDVLPRGPNGKFEEFVCLVQ